MTLLIEVKEFLNRLVGYIPIRVMHTEFALAASLEPGTLAVSNDLAPGVAKFQASFQVDSASTSIINPRHNLARKSLLNLRLGTRRRLELVVRTLDQGIYRCLHSRSFE
jgi:hypothetical protein